MTDRTEDAFASAAMMRLVAAGLARQGLAAPRPPRGARVPRAGKRALLEGLLTDHGPRTVLALCDAARDMAPEPVVQALARARDMDDLLDRWGRLERFSHGRHRVRVEAEGPGIWTLAHQARDAGPPPVPAESLIVFGLLAVLAEMVTGADAVLTGADGRPWRAGGAWLLGAVPEEARHVVLRAGARVARRDAATAGGADPIDALRARILRDPVRRWSLSEAASEAGMSRRTLQRRLGDRSLTFSRLVTDARLEVAAAHLCDAAGPGLAEIGFLTGHADQAHFTRTFGREVGTTPRAYRAAFGR